MQSNPKDQIGMSLFDKFFEDRQHQISDIQSLDKRHSLNLSRKLRNETDQVSFLSTISEVRFAQFFDPCATSMIHEGRINGTTPDWLITMNEQQVLMEVARLNPSERDKVELDFEDAFFDAMHTIQFGCWLRFTYDEYLIDRQSINIMECKQAVAEWLVEPREINDMLQLPSTIQIQLIQINKELGHVCLSGGGGTVHFDYRRLYSDNSALMRKAKKYGALIDKYNFPYIVCLHIDFNTWFSEQDLYGALYGLSTGYYGRNDEVIHSTLIENAIYSSPGCPLRNVSGILTSLNGNYTYFHNYSNTRLNEANKLFLIEYQHPYGRR